MAPGDGVLKNSTLFYTTDVVKASKALLSAFVRADACGLICALASPGGKKTAEFGRIEGFGPSDSKDFQRDPKGFVERPKVADRYRFQNASEISRMFLSDS